MKGYGIQISTITFSNSNDPFARHHVAEARKAGHVLHWHDGYVSVHRAR